MASSLKRPEGLSQLIKAPRQVIVTVGDYCYCARHVASSSSKQAQASNQASDMIALDWHVPQVARHHIIFRMSISLRSIPEMARVIMSSLAAFTS
ncbi:hypothetical protein GJ744_002392 [Endocarpon pusillum]|uniref:Uncharacterized protein n=1 Tax=Endocarpon pusillum TaxID=364733 RepID=A0A8H7E8D7_9EURO|nr:hypothetical protein GJ744_002392 [Endocarpon pusillum]